MSEEFRTGERHQGTHTFLPRFVIDYYDANIMLHLITYLRIANHVTDRNSDCKVTATVRLPPSYIPTIVPEAWNGRVFPWS